MRIKSAPAAEATKDAETWPPAPRRVAPRRIARAACAGETAGDERPTVRPRGAFCFVSRIMTSRTWPAQLKSTSAAPFVVVALAPTRRRPKLGAQRRRIGLLSVATGAAFSCQYFFHFAGRLLAGRVAAAHTSAGGRHRRKDARQRMSRSFPAAPSGQSVGRPADKRARGGGGKVIARRSRGAARMIGGAWPRPSGGATCRRVRSPSKRLRCSERISN